MLRQKAEEIALKLNTEFTPSSGWLDQFRKCTGLSCRTMSRKSKSVTEEKVGAWRNGVLSSSELMPSRACI
jgi:hypothetical protein